MSLYTQCPVCPRVFRPKSDDPGACWKSVREHVRKKAHECEFHLQIRNRVFGARVPECIVCERSFGSFQEACDHMLSFEDAEHSTFRGRWGNTSVTDQTRAALRAEFEAARLAEAARLQMASALYSAAKSGRAEQVRGYLSNGADPNTGGEDGFTPLMTASEAGHEAVVDLLVQHAGCAVNARNQYGQTALSLAAINGHVFTTLRLLEVAGVDVECVSGGFSAAEHARRAGHAALADIIAGAGKQTQLQQILLALTDGAAAGSFDSITARLERLVEQLAVDRRQDDDDHAPLLDDSRLCTVCLCAEIDTVLMPCFHACVCQGCAASMHAQRCPMCRAGISQTHRVYLP